MAKKLYVLRYNFETSASLLHTQHYPLLTTVVMGVGVLGKEVLGHSQGEYSIRARVRVFMETLLLLVVVVVEVAVLVIEAVVLGVQIRPDEPSNI